MGLTVGELTVCFSSPAFAYFFSATDYFPLHTTHTYVDPFVTTPYTSSITIKFILPSFIR